jgi:hypothetical protein
MNRSGIWKNVSMISGEGFDPILRKIGNKRRGEQKMTPVMGLTIVSSPAANSELTKRP